MKISFTKYEGAANDFVFIEGKAPNRPATLVRELCDRRRGVGSDGVVFIWKDRMTWRWRFFNPDGREAEVCGNAARCVALCLSKKLRGAKRLEWQGLLGTFVAEKAGSEFRVRWPLPEAALRPLEADFIEEITMGLNDRGLAGIYFVNVGNPHLVLINHDRWNDQDRAASGPSLRRHSSFGAAGTNVTWVSKVLTGPKVRFEVVTFERGVETETQACGSGALAAFTALSAQEVAAARPAPKKLDLHFPGGRLRVEKKPDGLWLAGPAKEVFRGQIT